MELAPTDQETETNDLVQPSKHRTEAGRARAEARKGTQSENSERQLDAERSGFEAAMLVLNAENTKLKEDMKKKNEILKKMNYVLNMNEAFKEEAQRITGRLEEIQAAVNRRVPEPK